MAEQSSSPKQRKKRSIGTKQGIAKAKAAGKTLPPAGELISPAPAVKQPDSYQALPIKQPDSYQGEIASPADLTHSKYSPPPATDQTERYKALQQQIALQEQKNKLIY